MRTELCEYCGAEDSRNVLVTPCQCYKKFEDRGWWHIKCLKEHLARMDVQGGAACPRCLKRYKIRFDFALSCDRFCSFDSLNKCACGRRLTGRTPPAVTRLPPSLFELSVIGLTIMCTGFAFYVVNWKVRRRGDRGAGDTPEGRHRQCLRRMPTPFTCLRC